ncbi:CHASE3 domain-containing protein [Undibacterium sp. TJN25]|uniref:sensor histidine kinase n=1 Tax=Undibacterium sp. TJN25 TaxID=3413056 RepID=UPI003BF0998B
MKLTLQTKINIGFILGLVTLSFVGAMAWRTNDRQATDAFEVNRARDVMTALEALRYTVTDGETGMRGYVISGEPAHLGSYQNNLNSVDNSYDQLRILAGDSPQQQPQLKILKSLLDERRASLAKILQLRQEQGMDAMRDSYFAGKGPALHEQIRQAIDMLQQTERGILSMDIATLQASTKEARLAIAAGGLLALLITVLSFFVIRRDVARRAVIDDALRKVNEDLQVATARAQQSDRIKSAFLATMSHELRTPLNSIIGFSGILFQELAGPLNTEQKKQLGMVRESSRHLLALVNDVLDISKVEAGQLKVLQMPFQITESLNRTVGLVAPLAEKKGLTLLTRIAGDLGEVVSDKRRLEQILINLLSNAVKFTEKGQITLTAERVDDYSAGEDGVTQQIMRVQISDTGMGISAEDLPTLFQPFRQIEDRVDKPYEGTGLGLAITQRLLALMGGQISVESEVGRGSIFTVILPRYGIAES